MIVACASTMQPTLLINVIQPPQTEIEHLTSKQHRNDVINYVVALHGVKLMKGNNARKSR